MHPLDPKEVLESLGIERLERVVFKNLSGGQKQRLSEPSSLNTTTTPIAKVVQAFRLLVSRLPRCSYRHQT